MKQYRILMSEPAAEDLEQIAEYIVKELREPVIARNLLGKIKKAVMGLAYMPTRHALVNDEHLAAQGIRKLIVENYIVFCVVSEEDDMITIIRILYDRRNWEHLL